MAMSLVMSASLLLVGLSLVLAPVMSPPGVVLGVSVPHAHAGDAVVTRAVRRFRVVNLVTAFLLAAASFTAGPWALTFLIVQIGVLFASFLACRRPMVAAKRQGQWGSAGPIYGDSFASEVRPRIPWLAFLVGAVSIAASAGIVWSFWAKLPEVIPTHWGPGFQPDAWADRSVGTVFALSLVSLGMLVFSWGITALVARGAVAMRSGSDKRRHQEMLAATNTGLGWFFTLTVMAMSVAQVTSYYPGRDLVAVGFVTVLVASIGGALALVVYLATFASFDGSGEAPDNDAFYKWGIFYYNPDDPAVFVEKRFGMGFDFNYARWQGKAFIAFILLVLAACLAFI